MGVRIYLQARMLYASSYIWIGSVAKLNSSGACCHRAHLRIHTPKGAFSVESFIWTMRWRAGTNVRRGCLNKAMTFYESPQGRRWLWARLLRETLGHSDRVTFVLGPSDPTDAQKEQIHNYTCRHPGENTAGAELCRLSKLNSTRFFFLNHDPTHSGRFLLCAVCTSTNCISTPRNQRAANIFISVTLRDWNVQRHFINKNVWNARRAKG